MENRIFGFGQAVMLCDILGGMPEMSYGIYILAWSLVAGSTG